MAKRSDRPIEHSTVNLRYVPGPGDPDYVPDMPPDFDDIIPMDDADASPAPAGRTQSAYVRLLQRTVALEDKALDRKCDVSIADLATWADNAHAGGAAYLAHLYGGDDRAVMYDHADKVWWQWSNATSRWTPCRVQQQLTLFNPLRNATAEAKRAVDIAIDGDTLSKDDREKAKKLRGKLARLQTNASTAPWMEHTLKLARSGDGSLGISGEEWDQGREGEPMLLPCANGIIDFRKPQESAFRPGSRDDLFRLRATTAYEPDAPCPRFERFVLEIMGGDRTKAAFMQRFLGYALLRDPRQRKILLMDGAGNNGKSLLFGIIEDVVGSELISTQPSTVFLHSKNTDAEKPSPFLASMRGKAIVYCSETPEGKSLDVNLVKQLTGNDKVKARKLYSEPVEIFPTWQICIFTNNRPGIKGHDKAIWNRMIYVPFTERYVMNPDPNEKHEHKIDVALREKLLREKAGIFNWLIKGAFEYIKLERENDGDGLNVPESIIASTLEYREEQDLYGQFFDECIEIGESGSAKVSDVTKQFKSWLLDNGYVATPSTQTVKRVLLNMRDKNGKKFITETKYNGNRFYKGIRLKPTSTYP